jgi:hypothetical protein
MADEIKKEQEVKEEKSCCCCEAEKAEEKKDCCCEAEKAEEKKDCCCEAEKAEEEKAESCGMKIAKSILRVVVLTAVCAVVLFFIMKPEIMRAWYEERDSQAVKDLIVSELKLDEVCAKGGFTYTITYFDEGAKANNGYRVEVKKGDAVIGNFAMFARYNVATGELAVIFENEDDKEGSSGARAEWNFIERKAAASAAPAAE